MTLFCFLLLPRAISTPTPAHSAPSQHPPATHNTHTRTSATKPLVMSGAAPQQPTTSSRKLVLLGESAVGKSSLVLQFVKQQFDDYRESTIGQCWPLCLGLLASPGWTREGCRAVRAEADPVPLFPSSPCSRSNLPSRLTGAAFLTQTVPVAQGFIKFEVRGALYSRAAFF